MRFNIPVLPPHPSCRSYLRLSIIHLVDFSRENVLRKEGRNVGLHSKVHHLLEGNLQRKLLFLSQKLILSKLNNLCTSIIGYAKEI